MALQITRRDIDRAMQTAEKGMRAIEKGKAATENLMGSLTQSLEIGAGALASGVVMGRFGEITLPGLPIPADMIVGVGMHALAFADLAGKYDDDLHNFADGILSGYFVRMGAGLGAKWAEKSGVAQHRFSGGLDSQIVAGQMGAANSPLTEAELAAMAQAVR